MARLAAWLLHRIASLARPEAWSFPAAKQRRMGADQAAEGPEAVAADGVQVPAAGHPEVADQAVEVGALAEEAVGPVVE